MSLSEQRTALVNQLQQALLEYYPAALEAFEDWTKPYAWEFVLGFPTPQVLSLAGKRKWDKFLHSHKLWRTGTVEKRLEVFARADQFKASRAIVQAKSQLAVSLCRVLITLSKQLELYRQQIEELFEKHPDHDLFGSLPGARQVLAPRLLAALGSDPNRYGSQEVLQYDSQPGSDPAFPREYEQDKLFAKLTWQLAPGWRLAQSLHYESWVNPDPPTLVAPFEATRRRSASVPAMTFGQLTHTVSANTWWDVRAGRFVYDEKRDPSTGDWTIPSRFDRVTGVTTGAPPQLGGLKMSRTVAAAALSHYRPGLWGADHLWKVGAQLERGETRGANIVPTGVRYVDSNGQPFQAISSEPSNTGGRFDTAALFVSDAVTVGERLTIQAGLRLDRSRAISQDLPLLDSQGHETGDVIPGLGTLYTWNEWSPRLGATLELTDDGPRGDRSSGPARRTAGARAAG